MNISSEHVVNDLKSTCERLKQDAQRNTSIIEELTGDNERLSATVSELDHRVRNLLQIVMGVANQTLRRSKDLPDFSAAFCGRIQALARAHALLTRECDNTVPISELLKSQLAPFANATRCSTDGPTIALTPKAAVALGLVLYELGTNATKYGALSTPSGRVDVFWRVIGEVGREETLLFRWSESGGPPVHAPARRGFGSELLQHQLKHELGGRAEMDFLEHGVRITLAIPAAAVIATSGEPLRTGRNNESAPRIS